jgi:hypothetical protein
MYRLLEPANVFAGPGLRLYSLMEGEVNHA